MHSIPLSLHLLRWETDGICVPSATDMREKELAEAESLKELRLSERWHSVAVKSPALHVQTLVLRNMLRPSLDKVGGVVP